MTRADADLQIVMLLSKVLRHYAPPQTKEATMTKKTKITKTKTAPTKSKRVSLNPQPILDAKTAALKERGVKLTWAGRKWHAGDREFMSLEMSKYSVEAFAKLFPAK
jgi:hypothetical protein